jgi:hypothetical protein
MSKVDAEFIDRLVTEKFATVVATVRRTRGNEVFAMDQYAELAATVGKQLGRDRAAKERIVARSPFAYSGMDAAEYAGASAAELATRELKALGITPKNSDPVELLDAHHSGRDFARRGGRTGSMDGAGETFVDRYLNSKE